MTDSNQRERIAARLEAEWDGLPDDREYPTLDARYRLFKEALAALREGADAAPREDALAVLRARCPFVSAQAKEGWQAALNAVEERFAARVLTEAPAAPRGPMDSAEWGAEDDPHWDAEQAVKRMVYGSPAAPPAGQEVRDAFVAWTERVVKDSSAGKTAPPPAEAAFNAGWDARAALAASPAGHGEGGEREPSVHAAFGEWFIRGGTADSRAFAAGWEAALRSAPTGTREPEPTLAERLETLWCRCCGSWSDHDTAHCPTPPTATEARDG